MSSHKVKKHEVMSDEKKQLMIKHLGMVKYWADKLYNKYNGKIEYEELYGYGVFGLVEAMDGFDESKGFQFSTYASFRVRGAMIDGVRDADWASRSLRSKQKEIEMATAELEQVYKRSVTNKEVADKIGISISKYNATANKIKSFSIESLDETVEIMGDILSDNEDSRPEKIAEDKEIQRILAESIDTLTENEKKLISLYYYNDLKLKEISKILKVSESRVSKIHRNIMEKLRKKMYWRYRA